MAELTQLEKNTLKKIIEEMKECGMFIGRYDAKHGSEKFMYGVSTVMEYLAYRVSDEYGDAFSDEFVNNMVESERKVEEK